MEYHPSLLKTDFNKYLLANKLSKATSTFYISDCRVFLRWVYQTKGDYKITKETFENYESYLKGSTLPTKTINRKLSSLRIFNKYLLTTGYLRENVMEKVHNRRSALSYSTSNFMQTLMLLILFGVIVILGSIILSESKRGSLQNLSEQGVNLPVTLHVSPQNNSSITVPKGGLDPILLDAQASELPNNNTLFGRDIIQTGQTFKKVEVGSLTASGLVFITPTSTSDDANYFVEEGAGAFTIRLSKTLQHDFSFNWMIIGGQLPLDRVP